MTQTTRLNKSLCTKKNSTSEVSMNFPKLKDIIESFVCVIN